MPAFSYYYYYLLITLINKEQLLSIRKKVHLLIFFTQLYSPFEKAAQLYAKKIKVKT